MSDARALLTVAGLAVRLGKIAAVQGVNFTLRKGGRLALLGQSGSGKTMTALAIAGLQPHEARVVGEIAWPALGRPPRLGRDLGIVFQDSMTSLNPVLTVGEQIGEVLVTHRGQDWPQSRAAAAVLLRRVELAASCADAYPHELSGGQRQRVAVAMAIAAGPQLLIADEATTALDTVVQAAVLGLIDRLAAESGMAVLVITHDLALAARLASTAVVLHEGRQVASGPIHDLLRRPGHPCTQAMMASRTMLVGLSAERRAATALTASPLLRVRELTKTFRTRGREVRAVDQVSLELAAGETVALVGGSGSGKTTLLRLILRLLTPNAGAIEFAGDDLLALPSARLRRARRRLQMVFQDPLGALNPRATVARQLADPLRIHGLVQRADRRAVVFCLLARVGLAADIAGRLPHEVSGGQRQRVNIARALATRPALLVLDEPLASLDVGARAQILALLQSLQTESAAAHLFATHDLAVVRAIADRVLVMDQGRIVEEGPPETVLSRPQSPAATALVAAILPLPE